MWKIKHIFDGDYGCEESAGDEPMVTVTLIDENGKEIYERISDKWLTANNLDIGSAWPQS
ncbi:MAG: hypothetical protein K5669_02835 [Lachnospiraceae bacterium]|nr:hypothetical protein [Lachnospiraceae bacterium]